MIFAENFQRLVGGRLAVMRERVEPLLPGCHFPRVLPLRFARKLAERGHAAAGDAA
jgi:hypothetical protein